MNQPGFGSDPVSPNTTYVQADPSNFRAVVQKLTGAPEDPSSLRPPRFDLAPRRPAFKLHQRRQTLKTLELNLAARPHLCSGDSPASNSPVSTLDFFARGSPRTPRQHEEEEEEDEDEKGFRFRPSLVRPGLGSDPPELLVLFPLHSPRERERE